MSPRWPWRSTPNPPTLVVVGPTHFDRMLRLPRLPRSNDRLVPTEIALEPGGMGGNVASAFARLGGHVRYAGSYAGGEDGPLLCAALVRDGVDVRFARERPGPPSQGLILVGERGERAIIVGWQRPRPVSQWRVYNTPLDAAGLFAPPVDALYCPSLLALDLLPILSADLPLVIDVEERHTDDLDLDDLRRLLGRAGLVFGNDGVLANVARRLGHTVPEGLGGDVGGTLVVTLGARGCLVVDTDRAVQVPGFRVRTVDTTGAGDCFAAAFTLGALRGLEPVEAAIFANAAAALSTRGLGSRAATPTLAEVEALIAGRAGAQRGATRKAIPTDELTDGLCKALQRWQNHPAGRSHPPSARQSSLLKTPLEV